MCRVKPRATPRHAPVCTKNRPVHAQNSFVRSVLTSLPKYTRRPHGSQSIFDFNTQALKQRALKYHQKWFTQEVEGLKQRFPEGGSYSLTEHFYSLPTLVRNQWKTYLNDPTVFFRLEWRGENEDVPVIVFFQVPLKANASQAALVITDDPNQATDTSLGLLSDGNDWLMNDRDVSSVPTYYADAAGLDDSFLFTDLDGSDAADKPVVSQAGLDWETLLGTGALLGVVSQTQSGAPAGPKPGLPFGRMAAYGAAGTLLFVGIHSAVKYAGVPKELVPLADTAGMVGTLLLMDTVHHTSAWMVQQGILSRPIFSSGMQWGSLVQASPYLWTGSVGVAMLIDAAGQKFGNKDWQLGGWNNTVATFGITTSAYVGLSTTTSLLTQAGAAAPGSEFALNYPRVMAFARNNPATAAAFQRLGAAYGSATGAGLSWYSVKYTGIAGGGGVLGGSLQVLGAIGAVGMGDWAGGVALDFWEWATDKHKDKEYSLVKLTMNYILSQSAKKAGKVGGFFMKVLPASSRALVIAFKGSTLDQGILDHWISWTNDMNQKSKEIERDILKLALASVSFDKGEFRFQDAVFKAAVKKIFTDKKNAKAIKDLYEMVGKFRGSPAGNRLTHARTLTDLVSVRGEYNRKEMMDYLRGRLQNLHQDGEWDNSLRPMVRNLLRRAKRQYAAKMLKLELAVRIKGKVKPITVPEDQLTYEQISFLFGGVENYEAVASGQVTSASHLHSESTVMQGRIRALTYLNNILAREQLAQFNTGGQGAVMSNTTRRTRMEQNYGLDRITSDMFAKKPPTKMGALFFPPEARYVSRF